MADKITWFDRIGIGRTCKFVGFNGGCVTLTRALDDSAWTVWLYDHPLATGNEHEMFNLYADLMPGHWLQNLYRRM